MSVVYIVRDHLYGEYYLSKDSPETFEKPCDVCGDWDTKVGSFEEDAPAGDIAEVILDVYEHGRCQLPEEEDLEYYPHCQDTFRGWWQNSQKLMAEPLVDDFMQRMNAISAGVSLSTETMDEVIKRTKDHRKAYTFLFDYMD